MAQRLPIVEELILLILDNRTGRLRPLADKVLGSALGGAYLLELALAGRLDNDAENVLVLDGSPLGHGVLDGVLRDLEEEGPALPLARALALASTAAPAGVQSALDRLMAGGRLRADGAGERRYEQADPALTEETRWRLRQLVLSEDAIPAPRDVALLGLVEACGLEREILSADELSVWGERLHRLACYELLNQAMFRALRAFQAAPYEQIAEWLVGTRYAPQKEWAGGHGAVRSAISAIYEQAGWMRGSVALTRINQADGFDCSGCAWPHLGERRGRFEFCENGARALASEATRRRVGPEFFERWTLAGLEEQSGDWLEEQGRLTQPMVRRRHAGRYEPIGWEEAFELIGAELNALQTPDEAAFYVSGRTSNETSFLLQLFARQLGTNNLAGSSNLCHEASGMGLRQTLGYGKGTVHQEDLEQAELVLIFGHNPGSNHARMLETLQQTVRNGGRIVAVNPLREPGLMGFSNPHEVLGMLGRSTPLAVRHLQVRVNGDQALVQGLMKAVLKEEDGAPGKVLDWEFIREHTTGFEALRAALDGVSRERIEERSGIPWAEIRELARWYCQARCVVAGWGLGITQQVNGVATVREIVNLLLLRGNVGRPGTGVCPVRGHSNVQGNRTMGVGTHMPEELLAALGSAFGFEAPRRPGLGATDALRAMHDGRVKVFVSMGGNLAAAAPDTGYAAEALRRCRLTVMVSTKLNRSHVACGEQALILPCLSRSEMDPSGGGAPWMTVEDTMGHIHRSRGCLEPAGAELRGEAWIVAAMARAALGGRSRVPWLELGADYGRIRDAIAGVVPGFEDFNRRAAAAGGMCLDNPVRRREFRLPGKRARFTVQAFDERPPAPGQFLLTTLRSHDQFNTAVFGKNDRYRGIRGERRMVLMNPGDMQRMGLVPEQRVSLVGEGRGRARTGRGFHAIPYDIPRGCAAAYFPEANSVVPLDHADPESLTPASKAVPVLILPEPGAGEET